jgi:choline dehydrogenase-like flavoprotein
LRGAPGVYVADTSLFPTSVGVPPQVTAMTLGALVAAGAAREAG